MPYAGFGKEGVMVMAVLRIDSSLLASAGDVFRFPAADGQQEFLQASRPFFRWGRQHEVPGAAVLLDKIEQNLLDCEELLIDYTRLFVNSFPQAKAHPFAGWYLGDEIYNGTQAEKMRDFYTAYGLETADDMEWPADHIMVELEFAALMLESYESNNESLYIKALQELTTHLHSWVPRFSAALYEQADSEFYRSIAEILNMLLVKLQSEMKGVA